jgi:hypothetical protein
MQDDMDDTGYDPQRDIEQIKVLMGEGRLDEAYALLTQPLHEHLYEEQSFGLLSRLPVGERVALAYDYILMQVDAGGFIQLIQNGYISLAVTVIEGLQEMDLAPDMVAVLDDVLKVYALNVEMLAKEYSIEEFARLYNDFKEFDMLEERYRQHRETTAEIIITFLISDNAD